MKLLIAVVIAGLGYALLSVWNAKQHPSPAQVNGQVEAQHMLVFHAAARSVCEAGPSACGFGQTVIVPASALPSVYKDAHKWRAWMDVAGSLTTYSANLSGSDSHFVAALGKYGKYPGVKTGWWSDSLKSCVANPTAGTQPCISQKVR